VLLTAGLDESASAGHDRIRSVSATLLSDCFMQFAVAIWEFVNSWTGRRGCGWGVETDQTTVTELRILYCSSRALSVTISRALNK
jgi:hypothetical protein